MESTGVPGKVQISILASTALLQVAQYAFRYDTSLADDDDGFRIHSLSVRPVYEIVVG